MPIVRGNPGVKAGKVEIFAFDDVDPAWIDCDGRALNVVDEPALFAAIGYTWGGAGPVFNVPAAEDDFIRNKGSTRPVGTREGDAIRNITGSFLTNNRDGYAGTPTGAFINGGGAGSGGGDGGHARVRINLDVSQQVPTADENRPRCLTMKYRIKR